MMMAYSTKVDNKEFPRKYLGEAKPVRINICEMGMSGHERGQSTTYKPCGIQCNTHLFSPPKRGLRLEFRSLEGLRATRIAGNHQSLQVPGKHKKPGYDRTSNTAMVEWNPVAWEITAETILQKMTASSWEIQIEHRRNTRNERRFRCPEGETPRSRSKKYWEARECLRWEPVAWGKRKKIILRRPHLEKLRNGYLSEVGPHFESLRKVGEPTSQPGNRESLSSSSPSHHLLQWEEKKGIYSNP